MLAEWFTYLITPCQKSFKQLGFLTELIGIKHRHQRCEKNWSPHLNACKNLIENAAQSAHGFDKAVILGSGLLLDIPIEALSKRFKKVILVDICHLRKVRNIAKKYPNIELIEIDISGTVDALLAWNPSSNLPKPDPDLDVLNDADYVASANLVAQLPLAPLHYLLKKAPKLSEMQREVYAKSIIDCHLKMLSDLKCTVTLITEISSQISDGDRILEETVSLYGHVYHNISNAWVWDLALRPEISPDYDLKLNIIGIPNLSAHPD